MSEFGSCCDFCGELFFKLQCFPDGKINLLFSHQYYSCIQCKNVDLCTECYSRIDSSEFVKLVNNSVLYKSGADSICDKHKWQEMLYELKKN